MQKKALLFLGHSILYNSSVNIQNRIIILGLKRLGFHVDVVSPEPVHFSGGYDDSLQDILCYIDNIYYVPLSKLYKLTLKILSNKSEKSQINNGTSNYESYSNGKDLKKHLKRVLGTLHDHLEITGMSKFSVKTLNIDTSTYDIVISSSDPKAAHLIVTKVLQKNKNTSWIQYWGDPWFDDISMKGKWKKIFAYFLEKKLIKLADRVIYASPITLNKQKRLFPEFSQKMLFVNQATEITNEVEKSTNEKVSDFTVSYIGDYSSKVRNIKPFLEAAKFLPYIKFRIIGSGNINNEISQNIEIIQKRLPLAEVRKIEAQSNILFAMCNKTGTQIPAKIYYLSGYITKPIIVAVDGEHREEIKEYLKKFNRYLICENDPISIANAIRQATELVKNRTEFTLSHELTPESMVTKIIEGMVKISDD